MSKRAGIEQLQERIGYRFRDASLLELALTHRSLGRDEKLPHNQRLEFLGDAVLGLLVAEMLYELYPDANEGDLSKRLVSLVNGERLVSIAQAMQLGDYLRLSASEDEQGGRRNPSNLEDACESLLGAVYRDGGLDAARAFTRIYWHPLAATLTDVPRDPKTSLQEWAQARGLKLPEYAVISAEGPAHAPDFVIEVRLAGQVPVRANASTKRLAERAAAQAMLDQLSD